MGGGAPQPPGAAAGREEGAYLNRYVTDPVDEGL
jgi:hypothetical protein